MFAELKTNRDKSYRFIVNALCIYVIMTIFYLLVSVGLENNNFYLQLRRYIPCILVLILLQYCSQKSIFSKIYLAHIVVAGSWIITYPLLYYSTYNSSATFITNHQDMIFGLYLMAFLIAANVLSVQYFGQLKMIAIIFAAIDLLLITLPILQWAYYAIYRLCISEGALMAIYQTNVNEGIEFVLTYFGWANIIFTVIIVILLAILFYANNSRLIYNQPYVGSWRKQCGLLLISIGLPIYLFMQLFPRTGLPMLWQDVNEYFRALKIYNVNHTKIFNDLQISTDKLISQAVPGTVMVIIGESESRNFMSAYTKLEYDTTPWLRAQRDNKNFIIFDNAYSSWNQTVPVLERALTEVSQYNDKKFYESASILDIAKKLGYTTTWLSNQGTIGSADTPITLVANTADKAQWTSQNIDTIQYDDELLKFLPDVDPTKNNFIVVHIMGEHSNYKNRFPPNFRKWGQENDHNLVEDYYNAVLHTDSVVEKLYQYAKDNLNLQVMIYFADHGEGLEKGHHPDIVDFKSVRIPFYMYLSDEYKMNYPDRFEILSDHRGRFFSNDMIYDTLTGVLAAQSTNYDPKQDLASVKYDFTEKNTRVMLGRFSVADDPYIQ